MSGVLSQGITSDQAILDIASEYLGKFDFVQLARQLDKAAKLFGFCWSTSSWEFANGIGDGRVLTMTYEAATYHGNIILVRRFVVDKAQIIAVHHHTDIPELLQDHGLSRKKHRHLILDTVVLASGYTNHDRITQCQPSSSRPLCLVMLPLRTLLAPPCPLAPTCL